MAEYIEREAVYREICADNTMSGYEKAYCCELIRNIPAADVAPVRRGKFLFVDNDGYWYDECSVCGGRTENHTGGPPDFNYCQNCGAKMDRGDINDER